MVLSLGFVQWWPKLILASMSRAQKYKKANFQQWCVLLGSVEEARADRYTHGVNELPRFAFASIIDLLSLRMACVVAK